MLGSIALTRNKMWLYNEQMTLNDKPKPFAKTYAKWVEFTDAMAAQVRISGDRGPSQSVSQCPGVGVQH